jgi:hypothetical protein
MHGLKGLYDSLQVISCFRPHSAAQATAKSAFYCNLVQFHPASVKCSGMLHMPTSAQQSERVNYRFINQSTDPLAQHAKPSPDKGGCSVAVRAASTENLL